MRHLRVDFAALFAFCDLHASRDRGSISERLLWANGPRYYDRQGFPIPSDGKNEPTLVWARKREDPEYSIVARDDLPDGSSLSTVWLGLDHGFGGRPLFFETMRFSPVVEELPLPWSAGTQRSHPTLAFPDPETDEDTEQLRYGSEEEALAAHHEIVRRIRVREGH